jgi:hypothetical protein
LDLSERQVYVSLEGERYGSILRRIVLTGLSTTIPTTRSTRSNTLTTSTTTTTTTTATATATATDPAGSLVEFPLQLPCYLFV